MANSQAVDLMDVGRHCSMPGCGQVDFLPFKCDCCSKTFCLEHRTYEAHNCPNAGSRQTDAIVCPLCARAIKLRPGQDPNEAFAQHQREGCDPSNYNRVHKKPVCPVKGCREKLNSINTYRCKRCGVEVCLNHRMPHEHNCDERLAAQKAEQRSRWNVFATPPAATKKHVTTSKASSRAPEPSWASTAFKSNQSRSGSGATTQRLPSTQDSMRLAEPRRRRSTNGGPQMEACPRCGAQFSDPVELVAHVESGRCGKSSACIIS